MSNTKTALLVRTCLSPSDPTQISYQWADAVKQRFEENGWQVIDLAVDDAVRMKVEELLQSYEGSVFLFYGHGLPGQMCGQDRSAVIIPGNLHLLKDQKVYVVACWTAETLGPAAANIAHCYLGYDKEISVGFDHYADYVERCVNRGILEMLDTPGCTIEQAQQYIIDEYTHWIDHFTFSAGFNPLNSVFAAVLRRNRDALAPVFGDSTATI